MLSRIERKEEDLCRVSLVSRRPGGAMALFLAFPFISTSMLMVFAPTLIVLGLSLTDWEFGKANFSFIGGQNYRELLNDPLVRASFLNTCEYVVTVAPISVGIGLALAIMIESTTLGKTFFRSAIFMPVVSTTVAMAVVWEFLLHPSLGPVAHMLRLMDFPSVNFLGDPRAALPTLAFIGIWQNIGFNMVIVSAGIAAIPREIFDAGFLDGARDGWARFWHITFPLLKPSLGVASLLSVIGSFRAFESVAALTQGGPKYTTEVLLYSIYREGFLSFRIGYASAITVVFVVFLVLLALLQSKPWSRQ